MRSGLALGTKLIEEKPALPPEAPQRQALRKEQPQPASHCRPPVPEQALQAPLQLRGQPVLCFRRVQAFQRRLAGCFLQERLLWQAELRQVQQARQRLPPPAEAFRQAQLLPEPGSGVRPPAPAMPAWGRPALPSEPA